MMLRPKLPYYYLCVPLLIAAAVLLLGAPVAAQGSIDDVENPQGGSLGLEGVVEGEPPEQAAAINTPVDGQTITEAPVTVAGTCQAGLIVEIYKNDVLAGSVMCQDNNTFELDIGLFRGENILIARVRDLLGQYGPDSNPITVTYDPPVAESDRQIGQQLLLTTNTSFQGGPPGSDINFSLQLSGGSGPYAISINWGDGQNDVLSRSDTGTFDIAHTYDRPGVYRVVVRASDDNDQSAFLQLTAIVNGEPDASVDEAETVRTELRYILWPLYVLLAIIPIAYWLGIRHQRRKYE